MRTRMATAPILRLILVTSRRLLLSKFEMFASLERNLKLRLALLALKADNYLLRRLRLFVEH